MSVSIGVAVLCVLLFIILCCHRCVTRDFLDLFLENNNIKMVQYGPCALIVYPLIGGIIRIGVIFVAYVWSHASCNWAFFSLSFIWLNLEQKTPSPPQTKSLQSNKNIWILNHGALFIHRKCSRRRVARPRMYGRLRAATELTRPEEVPMISSNSLGSDIDE